MFRWELKIIETTTYEKLEEAANELGNLGWEPMQVLHRPAHGDTYLGVFRRIKDPVGSIAEGVGEAIARQLVPK